jgi:hypothetical protein
MVLSDDLKRISVSDLQDAVAEAVSAKIGGAVHCSIIEIDFDHLGCVNARLSLREPGFLGDISLSDQSGTGPDP